ncbi:hypothetical protein DL89DRAFT_100025 [Linderina pennispora]|uniref:Peroxin/Ferlin domain-containing protein n=1 Tax=Linderina pennispora TaxID=61395 RepID=A0A1Y1VW51_9FUNG|nr:uncharacterized protein DL89DRAFT_100025 [Linderina pennispora]ORX65511.1 hypothetical protein DL89DRAFT_100025 [Linderina pennispora]
MDPPPWSDVTMKLTLANVHSYQLPDPSWEWVSPRWLIDMTADVDEDGWQYATRFATKSRWRGRHSAAKSFVRRRRWVRLRRRLRMQVAAATGANIHSPVVFNPNLQPPQELKRARAIGSVAKAVTGSKGSVSYTLKDGKYTAHSSAKLDRLKADAVDAHRRTADQSRLSMELPHQPEAGTDELSRRLTEQQRAMRTRLSDGNIPGTAIPYSDLDRDSPASLSDNAAMVHSPDTPVVETWFDQVAVRYADHSSAVMASTRYLLDLPLPTGGTTARRDGDGALAADEVQGYVDGVPGRFVRLTGLMAPEPTMPQDPVLRGMHYSTAEETPMRGKSISQRRHSRRASLASAVPVRVSSPPPLAELLPPSVPLARSNTAASALEVPLPLTVSVVSDDSGFAEAALRRHASLDSVSSGAQSPNSIVSLAYQPAGAHLAPYSNPYAPVTLGNTSTTTGKVDTALLAVTVRSMRRALGTLSLDRERLDVLREALQQGGVAAAAVWRNLGWLHYELLQYDAGRQQLIALMMQFAETCPVQAVAWGEVGQVPVREQEEYRGLVEGGGGGLTASQVWRFVIRPVVGQDGDLFYSDYKNMVVAVAKWSLRRATRK